ncbi:hypothetical protein PBRA_009480 [Plasmodiophora brassicae]|uniref:Uncharacterized protein n=1 Tax=Plasmodiophora brassicae TaxID=37360 RepID=A0A0G4J7T3_PLABS|nr:hypothetical protein PBRA_009480 [Plasmodiophora brassicae]
MRPGARVVVVAFQQTSTRDSVRTCVWRSARARPDGRDVCGRSIRTALVGQACGPLRRLLHHDCRRCGNRLAPCMLTTSCSSLMRMFENVNSWHWREGSDESRRRARRPRASPQYSRVRSSGIEISCRPA